MPLPSALGTQLISFIQLSKYVSNKWLYFFCHYLKGLTLFSNNFN